MAQKDSNTLKTKLQYIKINHKNKIEELVEAEYYNELMNLANCLQFGEHDIGAEINKFFQYILPENKEGDVLKVSMAISSKSKKNKKYATQCLNEIMNMKERNNLTVTKDLSEKLSAVLKEIYRKIKKHSNLKSFDELLSKSKECLRGGNIIKKYQVEKKTNIAMNSKLLKKGTIMPDIETLVDKQTFNNSAKALCKTFKEERHVEFQFKEFKEDKKEILPAMMRLLIRKFTTVSKIKLTLNNNNVNEEFKIEPKDIQNNILVLFNLDWLFQNLLELEVDLSNENLLREQIVIQSYNLEMFSELLNKDIKLSLYHSGIYKNRIFNPYQLSNFYSSSPQLKEEDYLYIQQAVNNNNSLRIYSNFGKDTEVKSQAMIQFIENKKHLLEMIIIYGYFISKMKLIRMCDFILPMNLEEEIILMLKMNKIILPDFHFLSFFTGNQIVHFTINFNSLDNQSFEKVLAFVSQNTYMNICRINFFQSEEYFKTELLYKLLQNCNSNYKELYNFNYSDNNYHIYDFKINEDLDKLVKRMKELDMKIEDYALGAYKKNSSQSGNISSYEKFEPQQQKTESISSHSVALGPQFTHTLPLGDKLNNKFKISGSHHFSFSSSFDSQGSIVFEKKRCCDGPNAGQIVQDEKWEGTISGSLSFSVASEQFSVSKYGIEISYWYGAKGEISGSIIGSISGESNKCDNEPLIVKASLNGSITGSALVGGSASLKINNWISVSGGVYGGLLANASFGMEFERHGDGAWQLQSDHSNGSISGTVTVDAIFAQYTFEHTFMEW